MQNENKRIILFIVEGINDKTSLALILSEFLSNNLIRFELTDGDITAKNGINTDNVTAKLGEIVKKFSGRIFKPKDFLEIIHLIDTDGAFVPDDCVEHAETQHWIYYDDTILANDVKDVLHRNAQKSSIINRLLSIDRICGTIPYRAYYFSSNMDHVLHGKANMEKKEKNMLARAFEAQYSGNIEAFLEFMKHEEHSVMLDWEASWDFIKESTNSLKRFTNFCLYLSQKEEKQGLKDGNSHE